MMIFNSFTVASNDYKFGVQGPNGCGRRFFLPTNQTLEVFVYSSCSKLTRVWCRSLGATGGESVNGAGYSLIQ